MIRFKLLNNNTPRKPKSHLMVRKSTYIEAQVSDGFKDFENNLRSKFHGEYSAKMVSASKFLPSVLLANYSVQTTS